MPELELNVQGFIADIQGYLKEALPQHLGHLYILLQNVTLALMSLSCKDSSECVSIAKELPSLYN